MGRKTTVVDPAIHGILGDPEVLGDLFDRGPWLSQWNFLPQLRSLRQYGMSKGILAGKIWQESEKVGYCLSRWLCAEALGECAPPPARGFRIDDARKATPGRCRTPSADGQIFPTNTASMPRERQ